MQNPNNYIGLGTYEIYIFMVDRREYKDKEGKDQHFNIAVTSVGNIMVNDDVYKALCAATVSTPALLSASGYVKDGAMRYNFTL